MEFFKKISKKFAKLKFSKSQESRKYSFIEVVASITFT